MEVQGRELRGQVDLEWNTDSIETLELENMTCQVAQDLEDDEHSTNLEKFTVASGHANASSSRNVSRATWTYLTSRGGVLDRSVIHRRPLDNSTTTTMTTYTTQPQGWRSGDSSPWMDHHPSGSRQGHPRYSGAVTTGGRGWPHHTPKGRSG